ncbi:MAG TPA: hypothetical protein VMH40_05350 [Myxococcaceae bacterium]|nr:hypothetical protein [Myxococcaceae bacterium]
MRGALGPFLAGTVVDRAGDSVGFLVLGGVALVALLTLVSAMPETGPGRDATPGTRASTSSATVTARP